MRASKSEEGDLGNLLASFREAGQLESEGSFTMAGRKAAGKLARSLLPDPADWILKVVQGACSAAAAALVIGQTSKATHIEFTLPFLLDIRSFELSLTQGTVAPQPGVDALSTALRVVGLGQDRAWVARLKTGETTHWVLVKQGEVSLETVTGESGPRGVTEVLIGIAFPPGQAGKLGGLVRFGAAVQNEHEALHQRARACPIPLTLDGVRLDTLQRSDSIGGFEHEAFLGVTFGQQPGLPAICSPVGLSQSPKADWRSDRFNDAKPFYLTSTAERPAGSSMLRISFRYQSERHARNGRTSQFRPLPSPSRVILVRHGVVVGRRNLGLTEPIAVDVYFNADQARSDLSGLDVEVLADHVEAAREEIKGIGGFLSGLEERLASHGSRPKSREVSLCAAASGLALVLAPWPLTLLTVALCTFRIKWSIDQYSQIVKDCAGSLAQFMVAYCESERPSHLQR